MNRILKFYQGFIFIKTQHLKKEDVYRKNRETKAVRRASCALPEEGFLKREMEEEETTLSLRDNALFTSLNSAETKA